MIAISEAWAAQQEELAAIVEPLDATGWKRQSRCDGWTVADVVLHLAQTNELALGSATGRFDEAVAELMGDTSATESTQSDPIDAAADVMVQRDRDVTDREILGRWQASVDALGSAFDAADPSERVTWVAGQLSVRTLMATRLAETWIHTGDVAVAFGDPPEPTDRLEHVARLAWRTLPYAFERSGVSLAGPVAFELEAPSGARWSFIPDTEAVTTISGAGAELCLVAARRIEPSHTTLVGAGPDAEAVLDLVRTYA